MNSPLESGLFLPIRFYNALTEQDRYKRSSQGTSLIDEVFIFADYKTLCPFQVVFQQSAVNTSISWKLICVDTEEEITMPYTAACWEEYTDGTYLWTSYLGNDDFSSVVYNGLFYIELTIEDADSETYVLYSDLFVVRNGAAAYDTENYRITSPSNADKRLIDATNLRITTNI